MIHGNVVEGVMSQTDMDAMMYKIEGEDLYLIGTSEHSMVGRFIAHVGAGPYFKGVFLLPGTPGLHVAALHLQVRQVAGAALQLPHGDLPCRSPPSPRP